MVKKIMYCDRCGKECEEIRQCKYRIYPSGDDYLDLCQKCSDDLVSWVRNVKAESLELKILDTIPRCKNCKFFEHDKFANFDGIPIIIAHEFCKKWGEDGCKTKEDGYCFLWEEKDEENSM